MRCLKILVSTTFLPFLMLGSFAIAWAWQSDPTHPLITKAAVEQAEIDDFVKNQLKRPGGTDESLTDGGGRKQKIMDWLTDGSDKEDGPLFGSIRARNHFHDPLEADWAEAGTTGMSSIYWSQKLDQHWTGNYSWIDVRSYFYLAHTLETKVERDAYLAESFRGVETPLSSIAWNATAGGDFGTGGYTTSAIGLKSEGLVELGSLSGQNLTPLRKPPALPGDPRSLTFSAVGRKSSLL